uniref:Ycf20 n=1 Tax=Caulerpa racemosa TaxID=76317 RepID=A0A1I9LK83_CAURA|nr:Ycf20 [Caulerpa racemosa]ANJ70744.1 Ycf20 [Caulerpa racemosa]
MVFFYKIQKFFEFKKKEISILFFIIIQNIQLGLLLGFFIDAFKVGS